MDKKESQLRQCFSRCSADFIPLGGSTKERCPLLNVQRRTFEKLMIEAERLGYIETTRQGSIKLVRLLEAGKKLLESPES